MQLQAMLINIQHPRWTPACSAKARRHERLPTYIQYIVQINGTLIKPSSLDTSGFGAHFQSQTLFERWSLQTRCTAKPAAFANSVKILQRDLHSARLVDAH